ncbi:MAG: methyltransferase domain-containing protein [Bdellovibrionales bacterium]
MDDKISYDNAPWWSHIPGSKRLLRDFGLARSTLYLLESWPLQILNRTVTGRWSQDFFPPADFTEAVVKAGRELIEKDAARASQGLFPLSLLKPEPVGRHLLSLVGVLGDSVRVAWRMRNNQHDDLENVKSDELASLPDYYRRNFHFQSDGYLSASSAARYEHQVEILFKGAAGAMRRLALVPLVARYREMTSTQNEQQIPRLIELGAGSGGATLQVAASLPNMRLTAVDLSADYLQHARKTLSQHRNVDFVQGDGASLNFKDETFNGGFSVFMFHELPRQTREMVLKEAFRVLKPGGQFVVVDSLQWDDKPELNWGLERFPQDFHEPFYKNYVKTPLDELFAKAGFEVVHQELGLLAKCIVGEKPSA